MKDEILDRGGNLVYLHKFTNIVCVIYSYVFPLDW